MRIKKTAVPYATRKTLDDMAFYARKKAQEIIKDKMVNRNRFTVGSIRVDKAKGLNINAQKSVTGSIAPYMGIQEDGGNKGRKRGKGVVIPTSASAGQGRSGRRTRLPRGANKFPAIKVRHKKTRAANQRQRNAINIATSKGGYAYLEVGRRRGIFKIDKRGNPQMMHDMTRGSVRIPPTKWMEPAKNEAATKRLQFYKSAMDFQINRIR